MTITEVSEKFNLSPDKLRYYERVGIIPRVNRNKSGIETIRKKTAGGLNISNVCEALVFPLKS